MRDMDQLTDILILLNDAENRLNNKSCVAQVLFSCNLFSDWSGRITKYSRDENSQEYQETLFYFVDLGDCYERLKRFSF